MDNVLNTSYSANTPFRGSRRHLAKWGKNNSENNGIP